MHGLFAGGEQVLDLAVAFVLSALIGLEREIRQKSAGLRTHTLVGISAAAFMLVSKYGFMDVLGDHVVLDPSRVAAQIVTGIGFIGGGLIFVRRDVVRGLTTAAVIWVTTAVGMASGGGLLLLAVAVAAAHFTVIFGFLPLAHRLPRSRHTPVPLRLEYFEGRGVLRQVLSKCTARGLTVVELNAGQPIGQDGQRVVPLELWVRGSTSLTDLAGELAETDGVHTVTSDDVPATTE